MSDLSPSPVVGSDLACYALSGFSDGSMNGVWSKRGSFNNEDYDTYGSCGVGNSPVESHTASGQRWARARTPSDSLFNTLYYGTAYWTTARCTYFADSAGQGHSWSLGWCSLYEVTQCNSSCTSSGTASASHFADCSTFISSDLSCIDDTPYAERLCLTRQNSTLLDGTKRSWWSRNESLEQQSFFVLASAGKDMEYLLHSSPYRQYVDDAELSACRVIAVRGDGDAAG